MGKAPTLTKQARANRSQSAAPRNSSVACKFFSLLPPYESKHLSSNSILIGQPCKASKIRCDRGLPCSSCVKKGLEAECSGDKDEDEPLNTATEVTEETVEPHNAMDDELAFLRAEGEPFFDSRTEIPPVNTSFSLFAPVSRLRKLLDVLVAARVERINSTNFGFRQTPSHYSHLPPSSSPTTSNGYPNSDHSPLSTYDTGLPSPARPSTTETSYEPNLNPFNDSHDPLHQLANAAAFSVSPPRRRVSTIDPNSLFYAHELAPFQAQLDPATYTSLYSSISPFPAYSNAVPTPPLFIGPR
jgi:hypothetical protein